MGVRADGSAIGGGGGPRMGLGGHVGGGTSGHPAGGAPMGLGGHKPLSQELLCFMSGNAFRRRGEIFCYRRLSLRLACPPVTRGRCGALRG